jgi:hypothetical protein
VGGLIERTYRLQTGLAELAPFVIGDRGYRRLYVAPADGQRIGCPDGQGARTLVRETADGVTGCIYFPDAMIRQLEAYPPQCGVREENLAPFATFVEEIDHLLVIAERSLERRPVSLFELELHANLSKYLVLARFLAGRRPRMGDRQRFWLRHGLFDGVTFSDADPAVRERYREAALWAVRLIDGLAAEDPAATVEALRRFHSADVPGKLRLITDLQRN